MPTIIPEGRSAVLLLLGAAVQLNSIAAAMIDPPAAWAAKIARGDMLYAAAPPDSDLMPSVENGFLGGDVGCRSCYPPRPRRAPHSFTRPRYSLCRTPPACWARAHTNSPSYHFRSLLLTRRLGIWICYLCERSFSGGAGGSAGVVHIAGVYGGYPAGVTRASFPNPLAVTLQPPTAAAAAGVEGGSSGGSRPRVPRPSPAAAAATAAAGAADTLAGAPPPPGLGYAGSALDLSAAAYYVRWSLPSAVQRLRHQYNPPFVARFQRSAMVHIAPLEASSLIDVLSLCCVQIGASGLRPRCSATGLATSTLFEISWDHLSRIHQLHTTLAHAV